MKCKIVRSIHNYSTMRSLIFSTYTVYRHFYLASMLSSRRWFCMTGTGELIFWFTPDFHLYALKNKNKTKRNEIKETK